MSSHPKAVDLLIVTGISGAGRSSTLKILEDLGFETVDNLPLFLLPRLVTSETQPPLGKKSLAIGLDTRSRTFDIQLFLQMLQELPHRLGQKIFILYLDCDEDVLRQRYQETRRRHPLGETYQLTDAIHQEQTLMEPLRQQADLVLDTSTLKMNELRRVLRGHFDKRVPLSVTLTSFAYRYGLPREADMIFDMRLLHNPYYVDGLKESSGLDPAVGAYIRQDPQWEELIVTLQTLMTLMIDHSLRDDRSYLTLAFGCTGGRHRSVYTTQVLGEWLKAQNKPVRLKILHRDLKKGSRA